MALEKIVTLSYDIRGEYKSINEITDTAIVEDGVELSSSRHRGGRVLPGLLVKTSVDPAEETYVYSITDTSPYSSGVQELAITLWTVEIHEAYEAHLRLLINQ